MTIFVAILAFAMSLVGLGHLLYGAILVEPKRPRLAALVGAPFWRDNRRAWAMLGRGAALMLVAATLNHYAGPQG